MLRTTLMVNSLLPILNSISNNDINALVVNLMVFIYFLFFYEAILLASEVICGFQILLYLVCWFVLVDLRHSNSISVISCLWYDVWDDVLMLLPTQGIFNLPHHIGMLWEDLTFYDSVSCTQQGNGLQHSYMLWQWHDSYPCHYGHQSSALTNWAISAPFFIWSWAICSLNLSGTGKIELGLSSLQVLWACHTTQKYLSVWQCMWRNAKTSLYTGVSYRYTRHMSYMVRVCCDTFSYSARHIVWFHSG